MSTSHRLPDFVIIGAAKSGTTTLFQWLAAQPEVFAPPVKEPRFFSRDYEKGLDWYTSLFAGATEGQVTGEASTNYTDAQYSEVAAARMAERIPEARLVYLLRHPIERLRSQYRHDLRRAVVERPLPDAVHIDGNPYVERSRYWSRLRPYTEVFARGQICVVRFDDVVDGGPGWKTVLSHLGLPERAAPDAVHNVTAAKEHVTPALAWLRDRGLVGRSRRFPEPIRNAGRRLLLRRDDRYRRRLQAANDPVPPDVEAAVWDDVAGLEAWLGTTLWDR